MPVLLERPTPASGFVLAPRTSVSVAATPSSATAAPTATPAPSQSSPVVDIVVVAIIVVVLGLLVYLLVRCFPKLRKQPYFGPTPRVDLREGEEGAEKEREKELETAAPSESRWQPQVPVPAQTQVRAISTYGAMGYGPGRRTPTPKPTQSTRDVEGRTPSPNPSQFMRGPIIQEKALVATFATASSQALPSKTIPAMVALQPPRPKYALPASPRPPPRTARHQPSGSTDSSSTGQGSSVVSSASSGSATALIPKRVTRSNLIGPEPEISGQASLLPSPWEKGEKERRVKLDEMRAQRAAYTASWVPLSRIDPFILPTPAPALPTQPKLAHLTSKPADSQSGARRVEKEDWAKEADIDWKKEIKVLKEKRARAESMFVLATLRHDDEVPKLPSPVKPKPADDPVLKSPVVQSKPLAQEVEAASDIAPSPITRVQERPRPKRQITLGDPVLPGSNLPSPTWHSPATEDGPSSPLGVLPNVRSLWRLTMSKNQLPMDNEPDVIRPPISAVGAVDAPVLSPPSKRRSKIRPLPSLPLPRVPAESDTATPLSPLGLEESTLASATPTSATPHAPSFALSITASTPQRSDFRPSSIDQTIALFEAETEFETLQAHLAHARMNSNAKAYHNAKVKGKVDGAEDETEVDAEAEVQAHWQADAEGTLERTQTSRTARTFGQRASVMVTPSSPVDELLPHLPVY